MLQLGANFKAKLSLHSFIRPFIPIHPSIGVPNIGGNFKTILFLFFILKFWHPQGMLIARKLQFIKKRAYLRASIKRNKENT